MHIAVRILLFGIGLVLLAPGLCGVVFAFVSIDDPRMLKDIGLLILAGLLAGAAGIWLIRFSLKNRQ